MVPAQPPLPTAWNFPFQSEAGSQTSILMSESGEGVSVAATRQNAGNWLNCCTVAGPVPDRLNPPAGTLWAKVIEVFGSARDDKLCTSVWRNESLPQNLLHRFSFCELINQLV